MITTVRHPHSYDHGVASPQTSRIVQLLSGLKLHQILHSDGLVANPTHYLHDGRRPAAELLLRVHVDVRDLRARGAVRARFMYVLTLSAWISLKKDTDIFTVQHLTRWTAARQSILPLRSAVCEMGLSLHTT